MAQFFSAFQKVRSALHISPSVGEELCIITKNKHVKMYIINKMTTKMKNDIAFL
jgi:hypothetical protein